LEIGAVKLNTGMTRKPSKLQLCQLSLSPYGLTLEGHCQFDNREEPLPFSISHISVSPTHLVYVAKLPIAIGQADIGVAELRLVYTSDGRHVERLRGEWSLVGHKVGGRVEWIRVEPSNA
jgi:hypothetical protein